MYEFTIRYADGHTDTSIIGVYDDLSDAIDKAWKTPGFIGYAVGPMGEKND